MNKGHGLFAGTFLAGAFLFHTGGGPPAESRNLPARQVEGLSVLVQDPRAQSVVRGEGPWLASCRYWAPSKDSTATRAADSGSDGGRSQAALGKNKDTSATSETRGELQDDRACSAGMNERWGIPEPGSHDVESPQIRTAIAIVPDPVHTHLSLGFDRTIQVLLQAAGDNGYLSSYYWLPWRTGHGSWQPDASSGKELAQAEARERQPGLIILKPNVDPKGDDLSLSSSYYKVIYVFLVAETPTEGVDGFQFQNALSYQSQIQKIAGSNSADSAGGSNATIIGPTYSGSAASLRAAIEKGCPPGQAQCPAAFDVFGSTQTVLSVGELMSSGNGNPSRVNYFSFAAHVSYNMEEFLKQAVASGYDPARIAVLSEDGTVFGSNGLAYRGRMDRVANSENESTEQKKNDPEKFDPDGKVLYMHFPREIAVLRNKSVGSDPFPITSGNAPSPYLHFSVKDSNGQDSVLQFSPEHSPLSQESQLMAIARELNGRRSKVVAISASDPLDEIFLARFFRRTCPDARLVFVQSDLLMARDVDVLPYVGSITVSPYSFMTKLFRTQGIGGARVYTDTGSEAYYNAASFSFWRQRTNQNPGRQSSAAKPSPERVPLEGYRFDATETYLRPPALWVTTLGSDGYYPLGLVHPCPNDSTKNNPIFNRLMPQVRFDDRKRPIASDQPCDLSQANSRVKLPVDRCTVPAAHPALQWEALCGLVIILCIFHAVVIRSAKYDSSLTHDLDVQNNDQPHRRSVYIRFSTSMLASMALVLAIPLFVMEIIVPFSALSLGEAALTLVSGLVALRAGFRATRGNCEWRKVQSPANATSSALFRGATLLRNWISANVYSVFNAMAAATILLIPALWTYICMNNTHHGTRLRPLHYCDSAGLSFAFRCLHPLNGVSPLIPVLLLLFGWYLWGLFQTWRMCFSESKRPRLPKRLNGGSDVSLFVSDESLNHAGDPDSFGLYKRLGCLLVTRGLIRWLLDSQNAGMDLAIAAGYLVAAGWFSLASPFRSIDHLMSSVGNCWSCPYEILIGLLFFPLFWCACSGWLRLILVWASLKNELLVPLENFPLRFAFSKLQGKGWMTVLSRVGMDEQRRDLDRCVESMRQMLHLTDLKRSLSKDQRDRLEKASRPFLRSNLPPAMQNPERPRNFTDTEQVEMNMAAFSEELLSCVLIPFWENERTGLVESDDAESFPLKARRSESEADASRLPVELHAGHSSEYPRRILAAEEFLAMRYMTLIRAVLGNMRYMMLFFSITFVLTIVAWNSYPFQPREMGDWLFTSVLLVLSLGMVWIFAQMHRDPILSRVTATRQNELGWDFYVRIISFGAIPILTWLAYQFPEVGSTLYNLVQPGASAFK